MDHRAKIRALKQSDLLYRTLIWTRGVNVRIYRRQMKKTNRNIAVRVASAYNANTFTDKTGKAIIQKRKW